MRIIYGLFSRHSGTINCMPSSVSENFGLLGVRFLGQVMSASGVSVDPEKIEAVMSWERPKSVFEIRSFL